jgi:hypothetical protein
MRELAMRTVMDLDAPILDVASEGVAIRKCGTVR